MRLGRRGVAQFVVLSVLGVAGCSDKAASDQPLGAAGVPGALPGLPGAGATAAGSGGLSAQVVGTGIPGLTAGVLAAGSGGAGLIGAGGAAGALVPRVGAGSASVLQYHNHANRDGLYVDPAFTRSRAALIEKDPAFMVPLKGPTYAQPLYFESPEGVDLIITATEQNEVSAFNALSGAIVWQQLLAPPGEPGCGGNIRPLGVTGTPVIDGPSRTLFVAAMTAGTKQMIYALSLDDGSTRAGWPVDVSTIRAGAVAFNPAYQHQRGALLLLNNVLYVPYGGNFQDCGEFHGWVVGVPLDNPAAPMAFATKGVGAGIWAPGGLASDGVSVIAATGNTMEKPGAINTTPAIWGHGHAVLRLSPDLKDIAESQTVDFFASQDWKMQDKEGLDLGSSSPALFSLPGATPADLVLAMGKAGKAYLLDQKRLGGMGGELQAVTISSGGIAGGLVQATTVYPAPGGMFAVFRATQPAMGCKGTMGNYGALKLTPGAPPTMTMAWCAEGNGTGSPIVTTPDGMTDSVVWYVSGGRLHGVNGETGAVLYRAMEPLGYVDKFQTPIVAKGRLYIAASDTLHAFTVK